MYQLNVSIHRDKIGKLWPRMAAFNKDDSLLNLSSLHGLILKINSMKSDVSNATVANHFILACFGKNEEQFVAIDTEGRLYRFDMDLNRFNLILKLPFLPMCICWSKKTEQRLYISLSNRTIVVIDIIRKQIVGEFNGLNYAATHFEEHPIRDIAVSYSLCETILWETDVLVFSQKLTIHQPVEILNVAFINVDKLATCFKDNSIFIWNLETLECIEHLFPPDEHSFRYRSVITNGSEFNQLLFAAGYSNKLHVWDVERFRLDKVLELPTSVTHVKTLSFITSFGFSSNNQAIGIFAVDGIFYVLDFVDEIIMFELKSEVSEAHCITFSGNSKFMIVVTESGELDVYSTAMLWSKNLHVIEEVKIQSPKERKIPVITDQNIRSWPSRPFMKPYCKRLAAGGDRGFDQDTLIKGILSQQKCQVILKTFNEYPERYRKLIWRSVLHLPENKTLFENLLKHGTHDAYACLEHFYPVRDERLLRCFKKLLSVLAFWSPFFIHVDYLPMFTFPFLKSFSTSALMCFEVTATILVNWCYDWFDNYPLPPLHVLDVTESLLLHYDHELLKHFRRHGVTSQLYSWSMLQTAFSDVFCKDDCLRIWDHIISNPRAFILCVVVAYNITFRNVLLQFTTFEDFEYFYHHKSFVNTASLISKAYDIMIEMLDELMVFSKPFTPLVNESYLVFASARETKRSYSERSSSSRKIMMNTESLIGNENSCRSEEFIRMVNDEQNELRLFFDEEVENDRRTRLREMRKDVEQLRSGCDRPPYTERSMSPFNCDVNAGKVQTAQEKQKLEMQSLDCQKKSSTLRKSHHKCEISAKLESRFNAQYNELARWNKHLENKINSLLSHLKICEVQDTATNRSTRSRDTNDDQRSGAHCLHELNTQADEIVRKAFRVRKEIANQGRVGTNYLAFP